MVSFTNQGTFEVETDNNGEGRGGGQEFRTLEVRRKLIALKNHKYEKKSCQIVLLSSKIATESPNP